MRCHVSTSEPTDIGAAPSFYGRRLNGGAKHRFARATREFHTPMAPASRERIGAIMRARWLLDEGETRSPGDLLADREGQLQETEGLEFTGALE